jgi:hypothetical protein
MILALAALCEKKPEVARTQLHELVVEFPENPVFASEMVNLEVPSLIVSPQRSALLTISRSQLGQVL